MCQDVSSPSMPPDVWWYTATVLVSCREESECHDTEALPMPNCPSSLSATDSFRSGSIKLMSVTLNSHEPVTSPTRASPCRINSALDRRFIASLSLRTTRSGDPSGASSSDHGKAKMRSFW